MKPTTTLARAVTPDGQALVLQEHDGHFFMKVGGVPLMSTSAAASEQMMADLACGSLPARARVLIGGLGFGFTLRRVLELCPADGSVEVAELLQVVVDWNRDFLGEINGHLLDDPRVEVRVRDVSELLDRAGEGRYDAILLDVDNSPDPLVQQGNAGLYDRGGIGRVRAALSPGGCVVYWSANEDAAFARELGRVFGGRVECIGAKAYPKAKRFTHTLFVARRD